jgi:putative restriction endonuclease
MEVWEHLEEIESDTSLSSTEREAVIMARRGQGLFRQPVALIERRCRITKVDNPAHLRASHAKLVRATPILGRIKRDLQRL